MRSSEHIKRIEEDAIGNYMGGRALTTRRFCGDQCTGVPTRKKMFDFWGDALQNLPKAAKDIHIRKGVIYNEKAPMAPDEAKYELGIVSYPGKGKYTDCLFVEWTDVPDDETVATDKQLALTSPPGQGWWPVIALQQVVEGLVVQKKKVLVVCWYQLLSDGRVISWWIYL